MDQRVARKGLLLTMAVYFLQPLGIGAWLAFIPHVQSTLDLSKSELALALLGMPIALLVTLQFAGGVVGWLGLRRMMVMAFLLQAVTGVLPLAALGLGTLFVALAAFGTAQAFLEVGLNTYAGRLEIAVRRAVMSRCHGFWALGLMTGSGLVALTGGSLAPLLLIALVLGLSCAAGALMAGALPKAGGSDGEGRLSRRRPRELPRELLFIGAFMFLVTLTEGAMYDWGALYLVERVPDIGAEAGLGVSVFAISMAAARFVGDWVNRLVGAASLARWSMLCALAGVVCLVLPMPIGFAYLGFALTGLGIAAGYPAGVSAVAGLDETYQASNMALMSTAALAGLLVGPPLIGFLADAVGLRTALAILAPGLLACLWLVRWLGQSATQGAGAQRA